MSIDTAPKRRSAVATRRLPWFRRFTLPAPDAAIGTGDRKHLAFVYRGIDAVEVVDKASIEWTEGIGPLHYASGDIPSHWTGNGSPLHWTIN